MKRQPFVGEETAAGTDAMFARDCGMKAPSGLSNLGRDGAALVFPF